MPRGDTQILKQEIAELKSEKAHLKAENESLEAHCTDMAEELRTVRRNQAKLEATLENLSAIINSTKS